jgi:DNA-binding CsgD family transcriptional regulator
MYSTNSHIIPKGFDGFFLIYDESENLSLIFQGSFSVDEINRLRNELLADLKESFPGFFNQYITSFQKTFRFLLNGDPSRPKIDLILFLDKQTLEDNSYKIEVVGFKIPATLTKQFNSNFPEDEINTLSRRELTILPLILVGMSNEEIANQLYISKHTADGHRTRIYKKLGVHSFKELVRKASGAGELTANH